MLILSTLDSLLVKMTEVPPPYYDRRAQDRKAKIEIAEGGGQIIIGHGVEC